MEVTSTTLNEFDDSKQKEQLKRLEAIFFVSGRFLTMHDLVALSDMNPILLKDLIEKLKELYDEADSALHIVEKADMWKMDVRSDYTDIINKLATGSAEFTKAEQETLAIIAFKQQIKQSVIIKIRGNKAYDHIKKFVDLGLLKKKKMGHTNELSLSEEFYDYFNVSDGDKSSFKQMVEGMTPENTQETPSQENSPEVNVAK